MVMVDQSSSLELNAPVCSEEEFAKVTNADVVSFGDRVDSEHDDSRWVRYGFDTPGAGNHEIQSLVCLSCGAEVQVDDGCPEYPVAVLNQTPCESEETVDFEPMEWFDSLSPSVDVGDRERAVKRSLEEVKMGDDDGMWVVSLGDGGNHAINVNEENEPRCTCKYREHNESCVHEFALYYKRLAERHEEKW